jgi:hypothetical protein
VPWTRLPGWIERFDARHPGARWQVEPDGVSVRAPDGARAEWAMPFPPVPEPSLRAALAHLAQPRELGVVLVRRGGFALAHSAGAGGLAGSKVGRRHVQGRTKAGGWSQQRFARRRDNQAREAFDAAADYAAEILLPVVERLDALVVGGDRAAVEHVLADRRLLPLRSLPRQWVPLPADPRRDALDAAVTRARSVEIEVVDPTRP